MPPADLRVLVVTGAGVSAESGIPTFRGSGGLWSQYDPEVLATHHAFERDPALVWRWYRWRRNLIRGSLPNPAHDAITRLGLALAGRFLLLTQNVDDLHGRASFAGGHLPEDAVVRIHGDIFVSRCERCGFARRDAEAEADEPDVPPCPRCGGPLRPGVVWFDELLDPALQDRTDAFLAQGPCDAVLVVGTTARFPYIIDWSLRARRRGGQLIEVNPEETPLSKAATTRLTQPAATVVPQLVETLLAR